MVEAAAIGAQIGMDGDKAFYIPSVDRIHLPCGRYSLTRLSFTRRHFTNWVIGVDIRTTSTATRLGSQRILCQ